MNSESEEKKGLEVVWIPVPRRLSGPTDAMSVLLQ